ncbi:MAG: isopentenyl-diphosphate Delta-isomerase [Thermoflavifilum sp.]|nr:isopentenyl-diphosphate Delta-isomerase [Thermoflavifilum sp.]
MIQEQMLILVDEHDNMVGTMEKMRVHQLGLLHRAFSVFLFNTQGEMLLQQRAHNKYHSAGLWTNACCSHPHPGEDTEAAAHRRLKEELGIDCPLHPAFSFMYRVKLPNRLIEFEWDHVYIGVYEGRFDPNQSEVLSIAYYPIQHIEQQVMIHPDLFTAWFKLAFPQVKNKWLEIKTMVSP